MQRSEALQKAEHLINGARAKTHGDAKDTHESFAKVMNILWRKKLKADLVGEDMYVLMIALKLIRDTQNPKNMDNPIDVIGYAALWAEGKSGKN
jgi:Zn-dependent metalloprotease